MKKMNPVYIFFVLIGLFFMFVGGAFLITDVSIFFVVIVAFVAITIFMMTLARKMSTDAFEQTSQHYKECSRCHQTIDVNAEYCPRCGELQETSIECEFCGHINPSSNLQCEECNALLK